MTADSVTTAVNALIEREYDLEDPLDEGFRPDAAKLTARVVALCRESIAAEIESITRLVHGRGIDPFNEGLRVAAALARRGEPAVNGESVWVLKSNGWPEDVYTVGVFSGPETIEKWLGDWLEKWQRNPSGWTVTVVSDDQCNVHHADDAWFFRPTPPTDRPATVQETRHRTWTAIRYSVDEARP